MKKCRWYCPLKKTLRPTYIFYAVGCILVLFTLHLIGERKLLRQRLEENEAAQYAVWAKEVTPAGPGRCKEVELLLLCAGAEDTRNAIFMLKTLLLNSRQTVRLHVVTGSTSHLILSTLFESWNLPRVQAHFYMADDLMENIAELISQLHSGEPYGVYMEPEPEKHIFTWLSKLDSILPDNLNKIIYLNNKMRFVTDVDQLWSIFDKFNGDQLLGLVAKPSSNKKQADDYLQDVLLLKLNRYWETDFARQAGDKKLSLNDLNKLLSRNSNLIKQLPCVWDVRLEKEFDLRACTNNEQPNAFYWGSAAQMFIKDEIIEIAKERISGVLEINGDLLRHDSNCVSDPPEVDSKVQLEGSTDKCIEFKRGAFLKRRTHLYYLGDTLKNEPGPYDVTLMTQFTLDRFGVFEKFAASWDGPVVAVLHVSESDALRLLDKVAHSKTLKSRNNVAYHLVYRRKFYPINYLRNVGILHGETPYTLFVDVDLIPAPGLYSYLKILIPKYIENRPNRTIVIPAFEAFSNLENIPKDKYELLSLMKEGKASGYRMKRSWNLGHKATNYAKWKTAVKPYVVTWSDAFEPYVVMRTQDIPLYEESLLERMGDKIAYGVGAHARGYDFLILHDAFVIHLPHPPSEGTTFWNSNGAYFNCGGILMREYKARLRKEYPGRKL